MQGACARAETEEMERGSKRERERESMREERETGTQVEFEIIKRPSE